MSARDDILAAIRKNRPEGTFDLPEVPDFTADEPAQVLQDRFIAMLERMGGTFLPATDPADPLAPARARLAQSPGPVCSAVPEIAGDVPLASVAHPADLASVDLGVVRAAFAVAETGSILLTEAELGVNTLAYLPQHLLVLLDPADIVAGLQHAYLRPEFRTARYASFNTGPSATADVEGVLIRGAQGVRSLSVVLAART